MRKLSFWKNKAAKIAAACLAGCICIGWGATQVLTPSQAAYTDPYMEQMAELGFMSGDATGDMRPEDPITRAEFVTIVNRAFGYDVVGTHPFKDVYTYDWYEQDVAVGYQEGYIAGVTPTVFAPNESITRETAAFILAKNLMMDPSVGADTNFYDSEDISTWSRGLVTTAAEYGLISGYPDGTFQPQKSITRGDAAIMLLNAVGTPVQQSGTHTLGDVWGNVTITTSGVTLKDTTIAGNLYISAGVELGDVLLENVKVLGDIIVSGGGISEEGDDSVVMRNVDANNLIIDNLTNQEVSVRVEGDGMIANTSVRANAFITDNTPTGYGLSKITLDGEEADALSVKIAGNVKDVTNKTPSSILSVVSGRVDTITVDEEAVGSGLHIETGAEVDNVNLDVGIGVSGSGDIGHLVVNAPNSTVSMLPDQITIRPGDTATIAGDLMDSAAAAESSADPRILAGYPIVTDLAPTTATVEFSANKKGMVYWAVSALADGSVQAADLINPPSYATKIVQNGSIELGGSNSPIKVQVSKLITDGSYYLSCVLVDARGTQSPLKVISFTTPDNTVPNFATGYPYMSKVTNVSGQVTVMPTKTCRLYYALLPKGATAPTGQDFKANSVSGNLGYGTLDVTKNTAYSFDVNSVPLEELESYDLYLWLTDIDGGQSSAVKKLSFTTVDKTPPVFITEATVNKVEEKSVGLYANLNEDGTLYWVIVNSGEIYPKPVAGQPGEVDLSSDTAKVQVANGMNALKSGSVNVTAEKDVTFNITGLEPEKAYDLYYVAKDKAGNYSTPVKKITIHTLDSNAPKVTQEFTEYTGTDATKPLPSTDIRLVFSEAVQDVATNVTLVEYYQRVTQATGAAKDAAREELGNILRNSIKLYAQIDSGRPEVVIDGKDVTDKNEGKWVIDYRYAVVQLEDGKTVITFPHDDVLTNSALNLQSGASYYFEITANTISDTSDKKNVMGTTKLDEFTTVFATVNLSVLNENVITEYTINRDTNQPVPVDLSFRLTPTSTEAVIDEIDWDMLLWADSSVEFQLYRRIVDGNNVGVWVQLDPNPVSITVPDGYTGYMGVSLTRDFLQNTNNPDFDALNTLKDDVFYEYAISFTKVAGLPERDTWSQRVNMKVHVVAGSNNNLSFLSADVNETNWDEALKTGVTNIGVPEDFTLRKQFTDQVSPQFTGGYPRFEVGSSAVEMSLRLDRPGTVYYVVAPINYVGTVGPNGENYGTEAMWTTLPESGDDAQPDPPPLVNPEFLQIVNASTNFRNDKIKYGQVTCSSSVEVELVEDLDPTTNYIVYYVLQGTSQTYSEVLAYRFTTTEVTKPVITLTNNSPAVLFETDSDASLDYVLIASNQIPSAWTGKNSFDRYVPLDKQAKYNELYNTGTDSDPDRTVIWALCTIYGTEGYSVFDEFADNSIRKLVGEFIEGTNTMGTELAAQGNKSLSVDNDWRESEDFTKSMTGGTIYYCFATAESPLGSDSSYAGVSGVFIPDQEPPKLTNVNTAITKRPTPDNPNIGYSGTVTFMFDEPVYQLIEVSGVAQVPKEVWQIGDVGNSGTIPPDKQDSAVSLIDIIGTSVDKEKFSAPNQIQRPASTLTIKFNNIPVGSVIGLFDTSFICDANSNSTKEILSFVLEETTIGVIEQSVSAEFVQK